MPASSFKSRTNSLAFAKSDCHTCTANHRRCDRKRPRCSSCSAKNIPCGGYPMQLTWPKSKSAQPDAAMLSEQKDDPFRLEPLSLQASIHVKDEASRSRPQKLRKFRFVIEQARVEKQPSTEFCGARRKQRSVCRSGTQQGVLPLQQSSAENGEIRQCTPTRQSISPIAPFEDVIRSKPSNSVIILAIAICTELC